MQNKGLVRWTTILLVLISAYYLSFTVVASIYEGKAKEYAAGDVNKEIAYLDSMAPQKVWLGSTLKSVRENQIGLGLDLKGGMNVVLELNVADVLDNLSGHSQDPTYRQALTNAIARQDQTQKDFVSLFVDEFHKLDPNARLAAVFGTLSNKESINTNSSDDEVVSFLRRSVNDAIDSSHKVLRNRIDQFGVVAPNIQKLEGSNRILVELPGITEPKRVRKLLQGSANLEFWECYLGSEVGDYLVAADQVLARLHSNSERTAAAEVTETAEETSGEVADAVEAAADSAKSAAKALAQKIAAGADSTTVAETAEAQTAASKDNPLLSRLQLSRGSSAAVVAVARKADRAAIDSMLSLPQVKDVLPRDLVLRWGSKELSEGSNVFELFALKGSRRGNEPALAGDVVTSAKSEINQQQGRQDPGVSMTMNPEGTKEWARLTKENVGRPIAIVLDDVVYSAPNVINEIPNGTSQITGHFTVDEATDLANTLKSGKMAASVRIVQEDVVGPSLGAAAIKAGVISFLVALVLLMIYMCLIYGLVPGIVVDLALLVNLFLTLGILASIHAVLTLPGIAGMVLTLGMAVDANVLVFERIKEELKKGKTMLKSIQEGYGNAFSAIIDSNVTTIMTGLILYFFGSGAIRGFATTLIIGLLISLLTAVFMTRVIFETRAEKGKMNGVTFETPISRHFLENTHIDFIGLRKVGLTVAVAILAIGGVMMTTIGIPRGIDFTGGRNYVVKFDHNVTPAEISSLVSPALDGHVSVIRITSEDQVRISTNYKVETNTPEVDKEIETKLYESLQSQLPQGTTQDQFVEQNIQSSQKVGASVADDIKTGATIAVILSLIVMGIYILIRFKDYAFSVGAFASVTFNTCVIIAFYAILWKIMPFTMEIDMNFIAAVLAIIGYSINDTIVVFDRIREELKYHPDMERKELFNRSLNITLTRTINTSTSTLLVVLMIFFFGGASMRSFTFAIILGIVFGTLSTLFVASPIAWMINNHNHKKSQQKLAARR